MSGIASVVEIWNGRTSGESEKAVRTYRRVWRVTTTDALTESLLVRAAIPVVRFQSYAGLDGQVDVQAIAQSIEERQTEDPLTWEVTVTYSTRTARPDRGVPDPLQRPSKSTWDGQKFQKPIQFDSLGKTLANSTGDPFDPPYQIDDTRPVLTITRTEAVFNPNVAFTYQDAVNSDLFFGAAPGTAKVEKISAAEHFENNILNYDVTYVFHFRRDGWQPMLQDAGFNYLGSDGKPHPILLPTGGTPSAPVQLNGEGQPIFNAQTTLTQAMTPTDQYMSTASTAGFPVNPATYVNSPVQVLVDQEVMTIRQSAVLGTTFHVLARGQNGTTVAAHAVNAPVKMLAYYLPFVAYKTLPFAALNLP
jgi:hypothetical protein